MAEPGNLCYSQFICKHGRLRPYYRDVFIENYPEITLDTNELPNITE